ncbi:MAG TPA: membrane-bound lytic murein transglycosylase MltF [Arenicellales bacterium]|nr:membrane-bound lytic murein transglycosylase MltF [Arenicellales bacterium]
MPHRPSRFRQWFPVLLVAAGLAALPLILVLDSRPILDVYRVQDSGRLRVLTIEGPTTYYLTPDGPSGFEYELLSAFAEVLGVELAIEVTDNVASLFPRLTRGDAYFAAAGLNTTESRKQIVRFSEPYQAIQTHVVYRRGADRPRDFADLVGRNVAVPAGSVYAQLLSTQKAERPALSWTETSHKSVEDLLVEVWDGSIDVTFAPSNLLAIVRQHHPDLRIGFSLETTDELAWAFPRKRDRSLLRAANGFLENMRESGELERLVERYYGAATKFDYVNVRTYRRAVRQVLPRYEPLFREAAAEYGLDWRLLAAQSYQESYWKPDAVSPTGVKGLMQLTEATAEHIGVADRTDPRQSVLGGARYLRSLYDRIHESVPEPDRTWFALAAYNAGLGHLLDARSVARQLNKNPNRWINVKEALALLTQPEWYTRAKHGQARGHQAVAYVTRIRTFYDILVELRPDSPDLREIRITVPAL